VRLQSIGMTILPRMSSSLNTVWESHSQNVLSPDPAEPFVQRVAGPALSCASLAPLIFSPERLILLRTCAFQIFGFLGDTGTRGQRPSGELIRRVQWLRRITGRLRDPRGGNPQFERPGGITWPRRERASRINV
jgi:hypothetical protein